MIQITNVGSARASRSRVIAALLAVIAAVLVVFTDASPALAVKNFDNAAIADQALTHVGQWGGQCKQFANDMASAGSGGLVHLGGGYYSDYQREGGMLVSVANSAKGDIIQLNGAQVDTYYNGMHTAIVVSYLGNNTFDVVDSNWGTPLNNESVHHHTWNPFTTAAQYGLTVNIWQLGNVTSTMPHDPFGSFDAASTQRGGIRVTGWAIDPDAGTGPTTVQVYVDGTPQQSLTATGYRSDVAAAYPSYGGYHGFDTVIPYYWGGTHTVTIYAINTGGGSTNPALGTKTAALNYDYTQQGSVQGDFTGDGKTDVAVFYDYGGQVYGGQTKIWEFTGNGNGTLNTPSSPAWDSGMGNWDWSHTKPFVADFNGDGKADIGVLYDYGNGQSKVIIFLSNGPGFNAPYVAWDSGVGNWEWPRAMMVTGDFTGDGKADIAGFYNYDGRSKIWVFTGDGTGHFSAPTTPAWDSGPGNWEWIRTKLGVGDFNGDGKLDLAALYNYDNSQSKIFIFLSAGSTFTAPTGPVWDSGVGNWDWNRSDLIVGDFTGDGKADVAGLYDYDGRTKLWLFVGNGSGSVTAPTTPAWDSGPGNWEWWRGLPYVGDYTNDGKADIGVFYNYDNGQTKQFMFTSSGSTFTPNQIWDSGTGSWEWGHILVS